MCGICGELRFDGAVADEAAVAIMRDRLHHRGPDGEGAFASPEGALALGFRRLRIIDLSANGNQPMPNEDGSVQAVFNGEIYNYQDLRRNLIARGHRFRSRSDTEVIVHLYEEKGEDAIAELDGMFAIAIWDVRAHRLTLARDGAGKKPLFYYRDERRLAFASEMKAFFGHPEIPIELDPDAVPYYFIYGYVPLPATIYKNLTQLEPGSLLTIDAKGHAGKRRYWQVQYPDQANVRPIDRREAAAGVRDRLTRAVERRLVSDVPLGAFLSGGVDSTIVVGLMSRLTSAPVKTFSLGFDGDPAYDETQYARMVAGQFATDHTEFRVSPAAVDLIDTLIWHHDGPFGDSSAVPTFIVSKLTREKATVVLTGDGGDELFAGYSRFYAAVVAERIPPALGRAAHGLLSSMPAPASDRHWLARGRRFFASVGSPLHERITRWNSFFYDDLEALFLPDVLAGLAPIDKLRYLDGQRERMTGESVLARMLHANFTSYLADDLLVKTDRCTMANSIEARSPFLDRELVEYVAALPDNMKLRAGRTKVVLRDAFHDLLPPPVRRRAKMGFGVPLGAWFRRELRDYLRDQLLAPDARYRDMLSGPFVEGLVTQHLAGASNLGQKLWAVLCFERWLRLLQDWTRAGDGFAAAGDRPTGASVPAKS